MHNNIMAAGSRDRLPMLAPGRYSQWQSRFLRYIDTRPNSDGLRKCLLEGPYQLTTVMIPVVPATENSPEVPERTTVETLLNMSPENKEHYQLEKEAIHLLLTGIRDEMYSTVDACKTAHDMWIATERLQQDTKFKGKEIAKPITPPSESASEEDSDPEQAQRDKDMKKNLALVAKYFKKLYKPTNNNLRTSLNSKNKYVDTTPRYKNDNQIAQFGYQRKITVVGARETVGSQVVQQSGIQCFNCKEFDHFAKECQKPKRVKDYTYHKKKMLLCKQAEKCVPLQAEQADWLEDMDEEIDEQELEAHYDFMAKIQEVLPLESDSTAEPLEQVQYDAEYNVFASERQHPEQPESISNTCVVEKTDQNAEDDRDALANLIANITLDTEENKKILKQLKKENASLTQELKECKSSLEESNTTRDSCLIALQYSEHSTLHTHQYHEDELDMGSPRESRDLFLSVSPSSPTYHGPEVTTNNQIMCLAHMEPEQGNIPKSDPEEALEEDDDEIQPTILADIIASAPFLSEEVVERLLALPTPPPSPLSPYSSPLPQIPSPPLPIPPPPPNGPTYVEGSLGSRATGIRQRDALPSHIHETEMPEMCLPLRKRPCRTTPSPGYEVRESSAAGTARQVGPTTARVDLYGFADILEAAPGRRMSRELGYGIRDTWDDLVGAIQEIAPTTLEGVNQRVIELSTTVDQECGDPIKDETRNQMFSEKIRVAVCVYMIWNVRNSRAFKNGSKDEETIIRIIKDEIRKKLASLSVKRYVAVKRVFEEWGLNPNYCQGY
ncbi:integrase, catalytic region, zinc finger, CCHC-type containing protein [Tanacetum coccineum]